MSDWRRALLKALGFEPTQENLSFLDAWGRWEGGATHNNATYNWLNTTHGPGTDINSVGVKAFPSFAVGIRSLAETLHNGRYGDILDALASGDPYKSAPTAGLETWVSGSPTGNPGYAQKILGSYSGGIAPTTVRERPAPQAPQGFDPTGEIARTLFSSDPMFLHMVESLKVDHPAVLAANQRPVQGTKIRGNGLVIPMEWSGTHVTDGLGWGTKTAHDFMGKPGTPVRLSQDTTVLYYHPEGAQGGGSMELRTPDGRVYWVGHIASHHKAGDHIRAGGIIAVIANQHVSAPHVHVDSRR